MWIDLSKSEIAIINSTITIALVATGAISQLKMLLSTKENTIGSIKIIFVILEARSISAANMLNRKYKRFKKGKSPND